MAKAKKSLKDKRSKKVQKKSWKFPTKPHYFMRLEAFTIGVLALMVFFLMLFNLDNAILPSVLSVVLFLGLYLLITYVIRKVRTVEEMYNLVTSHLEIVRKVNKDVKKLKVLKKEIVGHKLDRFFLGGYVVTEGKRHSLFFNNLEELEMFEKWLLSKKK